MHGKSIKEKKPERDVPKRIPEHSRRRCRRDDIARDAASSLCGRS